MMVEMNGRRCEVKYSVELMKMGIVLRLFHLFSYMCYHTI